MNGSASNTPTPEAGSATGAAGCFRITVIDSETRRGIPLVELRMNNGITYHTDSAGVIAFREPGLMDRDVFFFVESHGYAIEKDPIGWAGRTLRTTPGTSATIEMRRDNIAQRIYRITGQGIYTHSMLLGDTPPIRQPLLNSLVDGQDSVLVTRYRDRLFWVWGDTMQPKHPTAGNFKVTAAWSDLPGQGGLDPYVGVDLEYIADGEFTKQMVPVAGDYLHWIGSLFVVDDREGQSHMMAFCARIEPPLTAKAHMLLEYDDDAEVFRQVGPDWPEHALYPAGHVMRLVEDGVEYLCFPQEGGFTRVRADYDAIAKPEAYEGWTFLKEGRRYDGSAGQIERNPDGTLAWGWKKTTTPAGQRVQAELQAADLIRQSERTFCLHDIDTGSPVTCHAASVFWNEWRKRWIMILCQHQGQSSLLGEIWYSEADKLQGPYLSACRIVTHHRYSFYNPLQHPEFSKDGGRIIFFEGTYTTWFSGVEKPTPRYDYNQIMYRLDLGDKRLNLPDNPDGQSFAPGG